MILRMTVHNKKYTEILNAFVKVLSLCESYNPRFVEPSVINQEHICFNRLKPLVIKNTANADQTADFEKIVKARFNYYCTECPLTDISKEDSDYMTANFEITTTRTLVQNDENGEVLYVFLSLVSDYCQTIIQ